MNTTKKIRAAELAAALALCLAVAPKDLRSLEYVAIVPDRARGRTLVCSRSLGTFAGRWIDGLWSRPIAITRTSAAQLLKRLKAEVRTREDGAWISVDEDSARTLVVSGYDESVGPTGLLVEQFAPPWDPRSGRAPRAMPHDFEPPRCTPGFESPSTTQSYLAGNLSLAKLVDEGTAHWCVDARSGYARIEWSNYSQECIAYVVMAPCGGAKASKVDERQTEIGEDTSKRARPAPPKASDAPADDADPTQPPAVLDEAAASPSKAIDETDPETLSAHVLEVVALAIVLREAVDRLEVARWKSEPAKTQELEGVEAECSKAWWDAYGALDQADRDLVTALVASEKATARIAAYKAAKRDAEERGLT